MRRTRALQIIVLLGLMGIVASALSLSVEEAYGLIPHQRTVFQPGSAHMQPPERAYLVAFFSAIDQAIVAKVSVRRGATVTETYAPAWRAWAELSPPASLKATQERVKSAIADQQAYLLEIERGQSSWNLGHAKVRSSSANLQAAYGDLMRLYPGESATNKQAFYDYLCALDFL